MDFRQPYGARPLFNPPMVPLAPAKPTAATPAVAVRTGPWSGNNQLGNFITGVYVDGGVDGGTGQAISVFQPGIYVPESRRLALLKLDEWGMPQMWTMSILADGFQGKKPVGFGNPKVEIIFGSGGSSSKVLVDLEPDLCITMPCNSLKADIVFEDSATIGVGIAGATVYSQLGLGLRPANFSPVLTQGITVPAASNINVPVPAFARRVELGVAAASIADFSACEIRYPGGGVYGNMLMACGGNIQSLPVAGTMYIANPGTADVAVNAIWQIGL